LSVLALSAWIERIMEDTTLTSRETLSRAEPRTLAGRVGELLRLAVPVIVSRSGQLVMAVVNTILVGQYAAEHLAYLSVAHAITMPLFVGSTGFVLGTLVETARFHGAGRPTECGATWRRGLFYALIVGAACLCVALMGEAILAISGVSDQLVNEGGKVVRILALGLPFMVIYMTSAYFLEGLKRPIPAMVFMLIANAVNLVLNWSFIYGHFGLPAMGAEGSAWATTIVRALLALMIVLYIWFLRDRDSLGVRRRAHGGWKTWAQQRRTGYSAGLSQLVESSAFALLTLIAGRIGIMAAAGYSIAFQILGLVFMIALGIGSATAVLVGHARGRKDTAGMARAGWLGLSIDVILVFAVGSTVSSLAPWITAGFAADPALLAIATPLIAYMGFVVVPDTCQAVTALALRARGDNWMPVVAHMVSYYAVLAPFAWYLALHTDRGVMGILDAILIASLVSATLLVGRLYYLCRRDKK
jgi:MATE family multidrug resistance protein